MTLIESGSPHNAWLGSACQFQCSTSIRAWFHAALAPISRSTRSSASVAITWCAPRRAKATDTRPVPCSRVHVCIRACTPVCACAQGTQADEHTVRVCMVCVCARRAILCAVCAYTRWWCCVVVGWWWGGVDDHNTGARLTCGGVYVRAHVRTAPSSRTLDPRTRLRLAKCHSRRR